MESHSTSHRAPRLCRAVLAALLASAAGCHLGDLFGGGPESSVGAEPGERLMFSQEPTNAQVDEVLSPAVEVTVIDSAGATSTGFDGTVTLVLVTSAGGGTLAGTRTREIRNGVAVFPDLSIDRPGNRYRLTASVFGLLSVSSAPFDVIDTTGSGGEEPETLEPLSGTGQRDTVGARLEDPYVVRVTDAEGEPVPGITVTWTVTEGGGAVSAPTSLTGNDGQAGAWHTLGTAIGTHTVAASVDGLAGSPVTFEAAATHGTPSALAFTVQPGDVAVDEPISPPVEVTARDQFGNYASGWSGSVTVSLDANPGNATLAGTTTRAAQVGVATFPGLSLNQPGSGYRLRATATGLDADVSSSFDVTDGGGGGGGGEPATLTAVSGDGQSGTVGQVVGADYVVRVTDSNGDPVAGVPVSWSVTAGGGSVNPTSATTNSNGQASARHTLGTGTGTHSVQASVSGLSSVTFSSSAQAGPATELAFTVQPSDADVDEAITPAIEITAEDQYGNRVTSFTGTVSLAISTNPGGGSLGGTTSRAASSGVATFPGLSIHEPGDGYRLSASASGLTGATSNTFDITGGGGGGEPATLTIVIGNGQNGTVGQALGADYVVRVTDSNGDPVAGVPVSWSVTAGGGSVSPTSATTDGNGQASARHTLGTSPGTHSVQASVSGLSPVSFSSSAQAGPATELAFTVQPSDAEVDETITPAVEVTASDQYGNRATSFSGTVSLAIATNPGGGSLGGTTSRAASSGVATFSGLSISEPGDGYRLSASASGLSGATSAAFDITGGGGGEPATLTIVSGNGQNGTVGQALGADYVVRVTDSNGDPVAGVPVSWSVTAGGGSVSPTSATTNSNGQVSTRHTLGTSTGTHSVQASVSGLSPVSFSSSAQAGPAAELVFTTQPSDTPIGQVISPPVRVTVRDQYGNTVTGYSGSITMSIVPLTGTPLAVLSGTLTRSVSNGVATFDDLSIDLVGLAYRLRATGGGMSEDSGAFDIVL